MIAGIGTDLVEVVRLRDALSRRGERLAVRLLATTELEQFRNSRDPVRFLAKRFAAKEAILKAMGTGLSGGIRWTHLAIGHDDRGRPEVLLSEAAASAARDRGIGRWHLSISDEQSHVLAFAIAEMEG